MIKHSSILKISNSNIKKNFNFFKKIKKDLIVAPTIKADAYGLGSKIIFKLLLKEGCNHFFVATLDEGIKINNKDKKIKIFVLNGIQNHDYQLFNKFNLIPIINSIEELNNVIYKKIKFGLHIDTGINRLGINYRDIPSYVFDTNNVEIVISHLSSADEKNNSYNDIQKNRFSKLTKKFQKKDIIFSLANSNGSVLSNSFLFNMIRPGIGLYGGSNGNKLIIKKIKPVVILSAKIIQIKEIKKNEYVGYNQTYKTIKNTNVAIISIGYADGIPRQLSNNGFVFYKKNKFKIIGRISMDSLTIDISKSKHNLKVGTYVDLINYNYNIEDFAKQCNTISNEVLTSIGTRVKRIYV